MKGFEIALRTIVILFVLIMFLVVFSFFFSSKSGEQFSLAQANDVFFSKCDAYKSQKCDWRVTYGKDFKEFYDACKQIHGTDLGKFTCLYKLCCASVEDVTCAGLCDLCNSHETLAIDKEQCCSRYQSTCADSVETCNICGG